MGRWWQNFQFKANYRRKVWHEWSTKLSHVRTKIQIFSLFTYLFLFLKVTLKATWLTNLRGHDAHNKLQKMAQKRQYKFRSRRQQQESLLEYVGSVANFIFFHRRVWMPCLTHKQLTGLTETRPFHSQNIGKCKVSFALLLLNQHVQQWKKKHKRNWQNSGE